MQVLNPHTRGAFCSLRKKKKLFTISVSPYRKIFDLGLKNVPRPVSRAIYETSSKYFSIWNSKPVNNIYIYIYIYLQNGQNLFTVVQLNI